MIRSLAGCLALAIALAACPAPRRTGRIAPLPEDAYEHYLRGRAAFFEADYEGALAALELAAQAAPDEAGIAIARAQALYRLGERVEAVKAIGAVVARWPASPEAWLAAGELRAGAGEPRGAIAAFREAIARDRDLTAAYLGLAAAQAQADRPADAERTYRALVVRIPDEAEGHWRLAQIELAREDDRAAEASLRRVIELAPGELEPRRTLAAVLARTGRLAEAIALQRVAFDRSGADLAVGEDLVWLLLEAGDRRGALDVLGLYDGTAARDDQVRAAAMLAVIGELDAARRTARAAIARGAEAHGLLARIHLASGAWPQAVIAAARVAPDADGWAGAQATAAEAELAAGAMEAAARRIDAALVRTPDDLELVRIAAEVARRRGDVAGGRARFDAAVRRKPRSAALALAWASFELRAGDVRRAGILAEKVLAATPDDPAALNLAAYVLVERAAERERAGAAADARADRARARALLGRARRRAPGDPSVLDSVGWLARGEGDLEKASAAIDRAAMIAPHEAEIVLHAVAIALERGRVGRAARLAASIEERPMTPAHAAEVAAAIARGGAEPCYARAVMTRTWLVRVAIGSVLATAACKETPSKEQCDKLLAHLIDLEITAGGGDKLPDAMKADLEKQRAAIREYAVGQKFIETCTQKTPKKVVACGLEAKNADELAKCDQ